MSYMMIDCIANQVVYDALIILLYKSGKISQNNFWSRNKTTRSGETRMKKTTWLVVILVSLSLGITAWQYTSQSNPYKFLGWGNDTIPHIDVKDQFVVS